MSHYVTIARPYAKAIFEHAKACDKLKIWSSILNDCSLFVSEGQVIEFITNPAALPQQKIALLVSMVPEKILTQSERSVLTNLMTLLTEHKRLFALPAISVIFDQMRAEEEKTMNVDVISFSALTHDQEMALIKKLKHRLKREIALNVSINQALLGGAIIQAGDLVIDGSVRGELNKLRAHLVS